MNYNHVINNYEGDNMNDYDHNNDYNHNNNNNDGNNITYDDIKYYDVLNERTYVPMMHLAALIRVSKDAVPCKTWPIDVSCCLYGTYIHT